jgi:3-deoxy-D-manno-octulosonic-acid transferase
MGGTLQGTGGQNLIEPCSLGKPVILGPSTYNFAQVSHDALQLGAALSLGLDPDVPENILTDQLAQYLNQLIAEPEKRLSMSIQGLQFSKDHQGATRQTLEILGL